MGWWDTGVMGGDTPLDILGDIEKAVGHEPDYSDYNGDHDAPRRDKLGRLAPEEWESLEADILSSWGKWDSDIARQVITHEAWFTGVWKTLTKAQRERLTKAFSNDEWSKSSPSRRAVTERWLHRLRTGEERRKRAPDDATIFITLNITAKEARLLAKHSDRVATRLAQQLQDMGFDE